MIQESKTLERRRLAKGLKIWLDIIFYLALLAGFILLVIGPIASLTGHEVYEITIPVTLNEDALLQEGGFGGLALEDATGEIRLAPSQFGPKVAFWILSVVFFGAVIYGLLLLRRILATTSEGFPFHPDNPKRLNHLGWMIVAISLVAGMSAYLFGKWALSEPQHAGLPLSPTNPLHGEGILFGLLVLVLASIWKQAVQMAEDQSLTV